MTAALLGSEYEIADVFAARGQVADSTRRNQQLWMRRYQEWAAVNDQPVPADERAVLRFLFAHHGAWRPATLARIVCHLRNAHLHAGLQNPCGQLVLKYVRLYARDPATPGPERKVDALRLQDVEKAVAAANARASDIPPEVVWLRGLLVISRISGLEPWRSRRCGGRPPALALPAHAFTLTATDVRLHLPGGQQALLDFDRHELHGALLRDALDQAPDTAQPFSRCDGVTDPRNRARVLLADAWRRSGHDEEPSAAAIAALSDSDFDWLLANVDKRFARHRLHLAYLLIGFALAARHGDTAGIDLRNITPIDNGYRLHADATKTRQEEGDDYTVLHTADDPTACADTLCPACALSKYLDVVHRSHQRTTGPLFATRTASGWAPFQRQTAVILLRAWTRAAGHDPQERITTRSLRSGAATSASENGIPLWEICINLLRHRDMLTSQTYIQPNDPFAFQYLLDV